MGCFFFLYLPIYCSMKVFLKNFALSLFMSSVID